jgi:putative transposase
MTNDIHLIMQVNNDPLAVIMQNLALRYTKWINFSQRRTGHIFQGRYKAILLDADEYLLQLIRYVHLNPVRAELVKMPEEYTWSGHHAYLGEQVLPWLTTDWVLSLMGESLESSREAYRQFVWEGIDEGRRCEFHSGTCEGRLLGDDKFVDDAFQESHQERTPAWTLSILINVICNRYRITEEELQSPGKARPFSEARALAAVMVTEAPHLHLTQLSKLLNREVSALSKAAQRMLEQSRSENTALFYP